MMGRPQTDEAAPYYFTYIDKVRSDDIVPVLESQIEETTNLLRGVSEEKSLYRYAPDKWSIREVVSHVNDTERIFQSRALWFARAFSEPLPSFDQNIAIAGAGADRLPLADHLDEFRKIRSATLALFRHMPDEAWMRRGMASGKEFTVRAMAYITAGHVTHHLGILHERYL